jgi:hypothetical protein
MTNKLYTFTVEGNGKFPFDMLRYDQCWPTHGGAASNLNPLRDKDGSDMTIRRQITLTSIRASAPTIARWESFGWKVVAGNTRNTAHL